MPQRLTRRSSLPATVSKLEVRRLLASISGEIFTDQDGDGLRDFFETPVPDLEVRLDLNNNGIFEDGEPTTLTDENGFYIFTDLPAGTYNIAFDNRFGTGSTDPALFSTSPGPGGRVLGDSEGYGIEVIFTDSGLDAAQRTLVETSIAKWSDVIVGDLPDVELSEVQIQLAFAGIPTSALSDLQDLGSIDDLVVFVNADPADSDGPGGTLASAGPITTRDGPMGLTSTGQINIDPADVSISRGFVETVVHEVGHIFGIGTLWNDFGFVEETFFDLDPFNPPESVDYEQPNAIRERNTLFGLDPMSANGMAPIQIEAGIDDGFGNQFVRPGSSLGHWDEATFDTELMTPFAVPGADGFPVDANPLAPLSRLTIAGLEDLGYDVIYGAAENYGPFDIGPLPDDEFPTPDSDSNALPFGYVVTLATEGQVRGGANFALRPNTAPSPFFFSASSPVIASGQDLTLLAEIDTRTDPNFTGDVDFRDALVAVGFYAESNGVEGLQTTGDVERGTATVADTLLSEDFIPGDGFTADLDGFVAAEGEQIFYAAGYDLLSSRTVRQASVTIDSTAGMAPERPVDLRVVGSSTDTYTVAFNDRSTNEFGFLLQIAETDGENGTTSDFSTFDDAFADGRIDEAYELVEQILLPAQDGTGRYEFTYQLPEGEGGSDTSRIFRVRALNTAGNSDFAGRVRATTLGEGEVFVDNDSPLVTTSGDFTQVFNSGARAVSLVSGTDGTAVFDPGFGSDGGPAAGSYQVFANVPFVDGLGTVRIDIRNDIGDSIATRFISGEVTGRDVFLGTFSLGDGATVVFSEDEGTAFADTVRFLPTDQVS
ncbi:MAG: SdrD B-like domain-containing protein [Planctomycetota bacterium]